MELQLRDIFHRPTIKALAEFIGQVEETSYTAIQPVGERKYYPASAAQKRLFIQSQFEGVGVSYNMPAALIIEGNFTLERLEQVIQQLVARHETLRTFFTLIDGEVCQQIAKETNFTVSYREAEENEIPSVIREFVRPFELNAAPLMRVQLVKIAELQHVLCFDMHHIISDGVSMENLVREFTMLYQGMNLPELKIQYKDYAVWQREVLEEEMERQGQFWLETFADEIPVLNMPTDYPRPSLQSFRGDTLSFALEGELVQRLKELASATGSTLFMVLLAAYNILLAKYSGQEDLVIGTPIAGRRHADVQNIIGMFVNMLALRNAPANTLTFKEFLSEVKENDDL